MRYCMENRYEIITPYSISNKYRNIYFITNIQNKLFYFSYEIEDI